MLTDYQNVLVTVPATQIKNKVMVICMNFDPSENLKHFCIFYYIKKDFIIEDKNALFTF